MAELLYWQESRGDDLCRLKLPAREKSSPLVAVQLLPLSFRKFATRLTYLRFRVAREDYLKQLANYFDDIKFAGIGVARQEREKSQKLLNIFVMPDVEEEHD